MSNESPYVAPPLEVTQAQVKSWLSLKDQIDALKEKELALRLEIVRAVFPAIEADPDLKGTLTCKFPDGSQIKTTAGFNVRIDAEALAASKEDLIAIDLIPIDLLFTYKPSLSTSNYDKIPADQRAKLSDILSFERATPALKFVPAKED